MYFRGKLFMNRRGCIAKYKYSFGLRIGYSANYQHTLSKQTFPFLPKNNGNVNRETYFYASSNN